MSEQVRARDGTCQGREMERKLERDGKRQAEGDRGGLRDSKRVAGVPLPESWVPTWREERVGPSGGFHPVT